MTLNFQAPTIYTCVVRSFDKVIVELGAFGLILWVVPGLSTPISAWKIVKKPRARPWFPLVSLMTLFPLLLFFEMTSLSHFTFRDFVINAYVWLLTGILYRVQMFSKAIEIALAEAAPRQD